MALLDHIVILVPHSFLTSPPEWFSSLFVPYPGGRHADGVTENTLVLFPDGSYLEFIAFVPGVDAGKREKHKWGRKVEGSVVDWALTLSQSDSDGIGEVAKTFDELRNLVKDTKTGIVYGELVPGGRHRPDGRELRWAVSGAYEQQAGEETPVEPGQLPFWCIDETERSLRVPYLQGGVACHPAGVLGVATISVASGAFDMMEKLGKVYDVLLEREKSVDGSEWRAKTLAGDKLHSVGRVQLTAKNGAADVSITLFTASEEFVGRRVGGNVGDDLAIEFQLVAAY